ncbi:hypothetical protein [Falsigemmobacter faecalis]|uniref:hypothetical protein n=1 Tax=Falsigemmobacter faecalis TaxID=2488730 RepID=UPI0018F67F21|nr:hypothetical protein [Falsigemmobacter faecalis]
MHTYALSAIKPVFGRPGGLQQHVSFQTDSLTNSVFSSAEKIEEFSTLANHSGDRKKENPGALAGATGAEYEVGNFKAKSYKKPDSASNLKSGNIVAQVMPPQYKQMSRMLGYSLLLGTANAWEGFGLLAAVRLTPQERAFMAAVLLATLDAGTVQDIAATAVNAAGDPLPSFLGGMEDARSWASWASRSELKAYALACFEAMDPKDQAAFYNHISTVEVAA